MIISGANAFVNGVYTPSNIIDINTDQRCYSKSDGDDAYLCMSKVGRWVVQAKANINISDSGYIMSDKSYVMGPQLAGPWLEWDAGKKWIVNDAIVVRPESLTYSSTVAFMSLGSLGLTCGIVWLAIDTIPHAREMIYSMLSAAFTTFIAYSASDSLWNFLFYSGIMYFPRDTPFMRMFLGVSMFSGCYFAMLLVAWKCQYSFFRVAVVRWLGAAVTAYFGILTATTLQQEARKNFPIEMKDSGFSVESAELVGVVTVLAFTWVILTVFREASKGLRNGHFKTPPEVPWAKRSGDSSLWQEQLEWGEDAVSILVESFMVNQTIFFFRTRKLPSLGEPFYRFGSHTGVFWTSAAVVFLVAAVAIRSLKLGEGANRLGRVSENSVAMAVSWAMFRMLEFVISACFPDSDLAPVTTAFVATIVVVAVLRVLSIKGAEWFKDDAAAWQYFVFITSLCFGNISGLSWGIVLQNCIATVTTKTIKYLEEGNPKASMINDELLRFLYAVVLTGVAALVWWRVILPRSALNTSQHKSLIDQEANIIEDAL